MQIKLLLKMDNPPSAETTSKYPKCTIPLEDRVRNMIQLAESGKDSHLEWNTLRKFYTALLEKPKSNARIQNLINMLEPVLKKNGYYGKV